MTVATINFNDYYMLNTTYLYAGGHKRPTFTISGDAAVDEGASYELELEAQVVYMEGYWYENEYEEWVCPGIREWVPED